MEERKIYKYIYPENDMFNEIDIKLVLSAIGCENNGAVFYCPNGHSNSRQKITIRESSNRCKCYNCNEVAGTPLDIAKWHKNGSFVEGKKWLAETFGIQKVLNPEYVSPYGETVTEEELKKAREKIAALKKAHNIPEQKEFKVKYFEFDENKKYNFIKDLSPFLPDGNEWKNFDNIQKLRVAYTWFYNKSFELGSNAPKYSYYKKRAINSENKWLKRIGYLAVEDFDTVLKQALEVFPKEVLELVGLIKIDESGKLRLSFDYVKKGGLLMVPSFDLYSNTVTGFMLRPTQPEQWMIDKHMKEIQLSNTSLIYPLPFGLTYSSLKNHEVFYGTEGHPDAVALPGNVEGEEDRAFFSLPGVNGLHEPHLGLFKGKKIVLCYDQDKAGKKAAYGYYTIEVDGVKEIFIKEIDEDAKQNRIHTLNTENKKFSEIFYDGMKQKLQRAGLEYEIKEWDTKLGSDINDTRINGNINKLF